MLAEGVPASLSPALHYLNDPVIAAADKQILAPIETIRRQLISRVDYPLAVFGSPAPRAIQERRPAPGRLKPVRWKWVAERTSVTRFWGTFLYLCAKHSNAQSVLELGGAAGISACYLAAGSRSGRVVTIEGYSALAAVAAANLRQINPNAEVVNAMFDDGLDQLLPKESGYFDIVHIDGQHERFATIHYFERLQSHLRAGSLVIFDDIHWSADMRRAWADVSEMPGVAHAIDVGRYGLCLWRGDGSKPKQHNLAQYVGGWVNQERPGNSIPTGR